MLIDIADTDMPGRSKNKSTHPEEMGGGDVSRHIAGQLLTDGVGMVPAEKNDKVATLITLPALLHSHRASALLRSNPLLRAPAAC